MAELVTLDSSVIVAALRKDEAQNDASRSVMERVKDGLYVAVEPHTVLVEVAAAIRRRTGSQKLSARVTKDLQSIDSIHFQDLDAVRAARAAAIAQNFGVRGMDAVVIQIAEEFGATLVSLDTEIVAQAGTLVTVVEPREIVSKSDQLQG